MASGISAKTGNRDDPAFWFRQHDPVKVSHGGKMILYHGQDAEIFASQQGDIEVTSVPTSRRTFVATTGAALVTGLSGLLVPARAKGLAPTPTMRGGANNYRPGAPIVDRIGGGGFWMTGTVRRAGDGAPLEGMRIQIWAHTTEGHERDARSHGATLTKADGTFRLEMPQIVPAFGQPHGHLAYDSGEFETVFLRPVMPSARDTTLRADFVLQPA